MKGWFDLPGRPGDRTLEQQMRGLDGLGDAVRGRAVLDVGCAEGLVSLECERLGAQFVHGIDIVPTHIERARREARDRGSQACLFYSADAADFRTADRYDVVLLLAVLHKLPNPTRACERLADLAHDLVIIRLPPERAPVIVDERSGNVPHDIGAAMTRAGFKLDQVTRGSFDEWTGIYRRRS